MKRVFLAILIVFCAVTVINAQGNLTSKKGIPILPQAGDCALGVNAIPFFNYFGNMMNNNAFNTTAFNFTTNVNTIYAKYFLEDDVAIRGNLRIGKITETERAFVPEDGATDPDATVEDSWKNSNTVVAISGGLEKRRGHGRVQGFYGAEAGIFLMGEKDTYEYGNDIQDPATGPTTRNDFGMNNLGGGQWTLEDKAGSTFGFGVRGFVGVEYFFAPKISVAGEFGWGLNMFSTGEGERKSELWDAGAATPGLVEKTDKTAKYSIFTIDTDNMNGAIVILFHI